MQVIDALISELRESGSYNSAVQAAPSVILWTDGAREWESSLPLLRGRLPELVVLGEYLPEIRQGPAIWIKCVIEGVLDEVQLPEDYTPIIYLPGIERRDLRAISTCPDRLKPLAELQYRGSWWIYSNSDREWSVSAFLSSRNGGLGLDVARDDATKQAMLRVLPEILTTNRDDLFGRRLEASDFNKLVSSDPIRDLLTWMNDPKRTEENWGVARWTAFVEIAETEFRFNPGTDGEITAAELLCRRQGGWETVWNRFEESCQQYPNLPALLLKAPVDLGSDGASYPLINQTDEEELERSLRQLLAETSDPVREALGRLEKKHGDRRSWVWSRLGLTPLAIAIESLAFIAEATGKVYAGGSAEEMAEQYQREYWRVDDEVLKVMAQQLSLGHKQLINDLLNIIYTPWLEAVTSNFQAVVKKQGYPGVRSTSNCATSAYQSGGEVVFFVDGLRYDVAHRLIDRLKPLGETELQHTWAALPSVTATAKSAVTPVVDRITGRETDRDFVPSLAESDADFSSHYLRKYLAEMGWSYLEEGDVGDTAKNAWVQNGDIDKEGHVKQLKLASRIDNLLDEIQERVEELVAAGWSRIRFVTDHGWLLLPEPMPKVTLPKHLAETRWGRCAVIKDSVDSGFQQVGWYWNPNVSIAIAPGISSFIAGHQYDHGGLSLQECMTPVITLQNAGATHGKQNISAEIGDIRWVGLNCRVSVQSEGEGVTAVLRTRVADDSSSISKPKPIKEGRCSLMVDDEFEGQSAVLVLLNSSGEVIAKKSTLVGEE